MPAKFLSLLFLSGLIAAPHIVFAAPKLVMHVFEDTAPENNPPPASDTKTIEGKRALPVAEARQPETLQVHIYDRQKPEPREPLLSYNNAEVYFKTGYRRDELNWSIAAPGGSPNILSELTWRDIEIATINAGASLYLRNNWFISADATYGEIFDGKNQDSDYFGDNRTLEFSRSNNASDEGSILDISVSTGYRFNWQSQSNNPLNFELRPKIGFAYHSQDLKILDGFQTISVDPEITPPVGPFQGLNSSYDASWFGPWLGLESRIFKQDKFNFGLSFEYHYIQYDATAQWNLRQDFVQPESFTHEAEGYGLVYSVFGEWYLTSDLAFTLDFQYQEWDADRNGKDTTFFTQGFVGKTELNEVEWEGYGVSLGLSYDF